MKNNILLFILCFVLVACSSSTDEPNMKYTGPWQIVYEESFYEGNTKDPKFKDWFENHLQGFECAEFRNALRNTIVTYTKENGDGSNGKTTKDGTKVV